MALVQEHDTLVNVNAVPTAEVPNASNGHGLFRGSECLGCRGIRP